jgi:hypothetical protein
MTPSRALLAVGALLVLLTAGVFVAQSGLLATVDQPDEYERTTVALVDASGERLAEIDVRIADTPEKRYLGLSATDSLGPREGMLFVHDSPGQHAYVMRDMAFPLDIVFIAPNGTVTKVHHATLPPEGTSGSDLTRYRGYGRYVLELPLGTANETGLDEGDRVVIPGEDDTVVTDGRTTTVPGTVTTPARTTDPSSAVASTPTPTTPTTPTPTTTTTSTDVPGFGWVAAVAALAATVGHLLRYRRA